MPICRQCHRDFVYDDQRGYDRELCGPICDGIESGQRHSAEKIRKLEAQLAAIGAAIQNIVCVDGIDAGVIYLDHESPTHWDESLKCHVYEHEYFSPLGDALVALWKLAKGDA